MLERGRERGWKFFHSGHFSNLCYTCIISFSVQFQSSQYLGSFFLYDCFGILEAIAKLFHLTDIGMTRGNYDAETDVPIGNCLSFVVIRVLASKKGAQFKRRLP